MSLSTSVTRLSFVDADTVYSDTYLSTSWGLQYDGTAHQDQYRSNRQRPLTSLSGIHRTVSS